jgi:hypothetical protein
MKKDKIIMSQRELQRVSVLASPHRWFGEENPPCCLMASIDDATSDVLSAQFEISETSLAYLRLLDGVIRVHGVPASVYQDRHSALFRNDDHWTLEEQLAGKQNPTQVGRVLEDFGIKAIRALSPQAKGRIERLFATLQDRMIAEMKLDGITNMEKANAWLPGYLERHNKQFGVAAAKSGRLFRKPGWLDLDKMLSFRYEAIVGKRQRGPDRRPDNRHPTGAFRARLCQGESGCSSTSRWNLAGLLSGRDDRKTPFNTAQIALESQCLP